MSIAWLLGVASPQLVARKRADMLLASRLSDGADGGRQLCTHRLCLRRRRAAAARGRRPGSPSRRRCAWRAAAPAAGRACSECPSPQRARRGPSRAPTRRRPSWPRCPLCTGARASATNQGVESRRMSSVMWNSGSPRLAEVALTLLLASFAMPSAGLSAVCPPPSIMSRSHQLSQVSFAPLHNRAAIDGQLKTQPRIFYFFIAVSICNGLSLIHI